MKDFTLRNDTRLLMRNDPVADIAEQTKGKRVLFVYGGGSVKKNGCYDDIAKAVQQGGATLYELGGASRELEDIERGIDSLLSGKEILEIVRKCITNNK